MGRVSLKNTIKRYIKGMQPINVNCGHFKKNYLMNLRILDLERPFGKPQKL